MYTHRIMKSISLFAIIHPSKMDLSLMEVDWENTIKLLITLLNWQVRTVETNIWTNLKRLAIKIASLKVDFNSWFIEIVIMSVVTRIF